MSEVRLSTLVRWRVRGDLRAIRRAGWAQKAVAAAFIAIFLAIGIGAYWVFGQAFGGILIAERTVGPVLVRYILELCFLAVLFLGTVSFVVAAVPLLFRTDDAAFTAAMPVAPQVFFAYRFLGALALSSWPILLIALPALVALGAALGAGPSYALFAAATLALFVLGMGLASALISFAFAVAVRRLPATILHFLELTAFISLAVIGARTFVSREIFDLLHAETPAAAVNAIAEIRALFAGVPSHYPVEAIASILPYGEGGAEVFALIAVGCAVLAILLALVVRSAYLPLLQMYREGRFMARPSDAGAESVPRRPFPRIFRWRHGFLFEKDLLSFVRNPEEVSRAGFLLSLLILYVLAVSGLAQLQSFEGTQLFTLAVTFAFVATGYFALTLGMRFAFPSLSLEGKSAWVLWSSPVHAHEFFSWKFFFWAVLVTGAMEAVSWAAAALLGLPAGLTGFLAFAVLCSSISLVAVTLGQGSLFPDFRQKEADLLTTSPAGLAATGIGLAYLWIIARYVHRFTTALIVEGHGDLIEAFGILIVSLAVVTAYWSLSRRRMDQLEIA